MSSQKKESSTQRTLHAAVSTHKGTNGEFLLDDSIAQITGDVNKKKKDFSQVTSGSTVPSVLNDPSFFDDSIHQNDPKVNPFREERGKPYYLWRKTESPTSETAYGEIVTTESEAGLSKRHIVKRFQHPKCLHVETLHLSLT